MAAVQLTSNEAMNLALQSYYIKMYKKTGDATYLNALPKDVQVTLTKPMDLSSYLVE